MFGKRQILVSICGVALAGSVVASENSSALPVQGSSRAYIQPFGALRNIQLNSSVMGSDEPREWALRFQYLRNIGEKINSYLPLISLTEMEKTLCAAIRASQNGMAIGELTVSNNFTNMAGIPDNKPTPQWTIADKVKFYIYHVSLATYSTNPAEVLFNLYGIRRLCDSFNSLQLQGQVTLDDLMSDTEASTDQE